MSDKIICAECDFCIPDGYYKSSYNCKKTQTVDIDIITGEKTIRYSTCTAERLYGVCGYSGKNFIPKKKSDRFSYHITEYIYGTPKYFFIIYFAIGWFLAEVVKGFIS